MRDPFETISIIGGDDVSETSWFRYAACRGEDPEMFFHPEGERGRLREARIQRAKVFCRSCPVQRTCAEWAIEKGEEYGIWGNMSEAELESIRKMRNNAKLENLR